MPQLWLIVLVALLAPMPARGQSEWELNRRQELRAWIDALLADADSRASLSGDGATAGWDDHFFLQSADGDYRLEVSGQSQFQYIYSQQSNSPEDDSRGGFQTRRLKLSFDGHVVDPSLEFKLSIDFSRNESFGRLSDGYVSKSFDNGLKLRMGQFKPPFLYEVLVSSKRQLAVDRSLIANLRDFEQNRAMGIELSARGEQVGWAIMYHNGFDTDRGTALEEDTEYAVTGRVEYLVAGSWRQFRDFSSWRDDDFGARVGAALSFDEDEYGTPSGPEVRRMAWTVDSSLEFGGTTLFASLVGVKTHTDGAPDFERYGVVVQGGHFIADNLEIFARYEWTDLDESGVSDLSLLTVGFTRFFNKHTLKWVTDVGYGFDEIDDRLATDRVGWRADTPDEDGQLVIRTMFQFLF